MTTPPDPDAAVGIALVGVTFVFAVMGGAVVLVAASGPILALVVLALF